MSLINYLNDVCIKINRGCQKPGLKYCDKTNDKSLIVIVKDWSCSITKINETEKDENECLIKIKAHASTCQESGEISKSLASFTCTHLTISFIPKLKK